MKRCPTLADLPPPPSGKTGWPWTEECSQLPDVRRDGSSWPRISIVTPSFNQGQFIEETIRSILLQATLTSSTSLWTAARRTKVSKLSKIRAVADTLESTKDRGQAHAINKGLERATGHWFHWMNSDDVVKRGALEIVGSQPLTVTMFAAATEHGTEQRRAINKNQNLDSISMMSWYARGRHTKSQNVSCAPPSIWLRCSGLKQLGGVEERFHYIFDSHMLSRYLELFPNVEYSNFVTTYFRYHDNSKSISQNEKFYQESREMAFLLSKQLKFRKNREIARAILHDQIDHELVSVQTSPDELRKYSFSQFIFFLAADAVRFRHVRPFRYFVGAAIRTLCAR